MVEVNYNVQKSATIRQRKNSLDTHGFLLLEPDRVGLKQSRISLEAMDVKISKILAEEGDHVGKEAHFGKKLKKVRR